MFKKLFGLEGPKKIGLALGGGVARGLAHVGVLKVLDAHKIPIDYIAGTSTGSLIAALYAGGVPPRKLEDIAIRTGWSKLVKFSFSTHGPLSAEGIRRFVENRIGKDTKFEDLSIPLKIVCTDLVSGNPYIFEKGNIAKAVQASCSFPGIFKPVLHEGHFLVDGGIVNNIPCSVVQEMGADFVIAVDTVPGFELLEHPRNIVEVLGRSVDLMLKGLGAKGSQLADILIEPEFDEDVWHFDLHKADHLISEGEIAANKVIEEIEKRLE
jgi:NTE family protein